MWWERIQLGRGSDGEITKNQTRDWTIALWEIDGNYHRNLDYWTKSEAEKFYSHVKKLDVAAS